MRADLQAQVFWLLFPHSIRQRPLQFITAQKILALGQLGLRDLGDLLGGLLVGVFAAWCHEAFSPRSG